MAAAIGLAKSGVKVTLADLQTLKQLSEPEFDGREIAINHMSKCIMQELGIWQHLKDDDVHPLKQAKVENGKSPRFLHFERDDSSGKPLGFLIANHSIRKATYQALASHKNIDLMTGHKLVGIEKNSNNNTVSLEAIVETESEAKDEPKQIIELTAKLLIAADSRFSKARSMMGISAHMKDFGKSMMVFNAHHKIDHHHTAQEIFNYGGTCAILPLAPFTSSIVITNNSSHIARLEQLDDNRLCYEAERLLDSRLGTLEKVSKTVSYPLVGVYSDRFIGQRFALVGDAAVGMHPVTAHGYNLGLRSIDTLCQQVHKAHRQGKDIGSSWVLHNYEARHKILSKPIYQATNLLVELFTNDRPAAKVARTLALGISNKLRPFKNLITQRLIEER